MSGAAGRGRRSGRRRRRYCAETSIIRAKVEATVGEQKQREKYYASRIKSNLTHRLQCVKAAQGDEERERERKEGEQQTHFNAGLLNALSMRAPSPPPPCSRWLLSCALPLSLLVLFACLSKGHVALDMSGDKHTRAHTQAHTDWQSATPTRLHKHVQSPVGGQSSAAQHVPLDYAAPGCAVGSRRDMRKEAA